MMTARFDSLPEEVERLHQRLDEIERRLENLGSKGSEDQDEAMDIKAAAAFLGLTTTTINSKVSRGTITQPVKRDGKRYWTKKQLNKWLLEGDEEDASQVTDRAISRMQDARKKSNGF
jgi:DNA-binding transcriptional MerR regulator